jgi:hypothetical protein
VEQLPVHQIVADLLDVHHCLRTPISSLEAGAEQFSRNLDCASFARTVKEYVPVQKEKPKHVGKVEQTHENSKQLTQEIRLARENLAYRTPTRVECGKTEGADDPVHTGPTLGRSS